MQVARSLLQIVAACGLFMSAPVFARECAADSGAEREGRSCDGGPQRRSLAETYPSIDAGSTKEQNPRVLCPFLRMLERAGLFDREKETQSQLTIGIIKVASAAREFGCSFVACGGVATAASAGQLTQLATIPGKINIERLHKAVGVAHDCGFTFAKGGTVVDDATRDRSLARIAARADGEGRLRWTDLMAVKKQICAEQNAPITLPGSVEVDLIYTFLGGNARGFVDYDDVARLFNAELPQTIGAPGTANVLAEKLAMGLP